MPSIYRSRSGHESITAWCRDRLGRWPVPHETRRITVLGRDTHTLTAGAGPQTVVVVPGTNFPGAAYLPFAEALAVASRVVLLDLPGQPGLSSGERAPGRDRLGWYGRWLTAAVDQLVEPSHASAVLVGHSLGAAIVLAGASDRVERQVLVTPGGVTRLRVTPRIAATAAGWVLRRRQRDSARMLQLMHGPGHRPTADLIEWMTLVARHVRTTTDPGTTAPARRDVARTVIGGGQDAFLPPHHLAPAVRRHLGTGLTVLRSAGHLLVQEYPEQLAELVGPTGSGSRAAASGCRS